MNEPVDRATALTPATQATAVERVFREEYGRLIATIVRRFGDLDIAQEAAGDALVAALTRWPDTGVPPNPGAWLATTAGNRAIDRLHEEGRYRVFIDILRNRGSFPNARCFAGHNGPNPITVWCSNDYLAMGQHPLVIAAMEEALHDVGAGSGGTRNIGGNTHYHVELESELASLHGKGAALLLSLIHISEPTRPY